MKKNLLLIGLALSVLTVGCSKSDTPDPDPVPVDDVTTTVNVSFADGFVAEDAIAINGKVCDPISVEEGVTTYTTGDLRSVVAVYPAAYAAEQGSVEFPSTQLPLDTPVYAGVTDKVTSLTDTEKEASVELSAVSTKVILPIAFDDTKSDPVAIQTVTITSMKETPLAGTFKVQVVDGATVLVADEVSASAQILLDEPTALSVDPAYFEFTVPVGVYKGGFEFVATDTEGHSYVYQKSDDVEATVENPVVYEPVQFEIIEKGPQTLNITVPGTIKWAEGDQVIVNGELSEPVGASFVGESTATFDFQNIALPYTVFYPTDLYAKTGTVRFYPEQDIRPGEFDRTAYALVGYGLKNDIEVSPLCGVLAIPVVNEKLEDAVTIQKVVLSTEAIPDTEYAGLGNEPLAGKFAVNYRDGGMTKVTNVTTLTLNCHDFVVAPESRTYIYAVVPKASFVGGIKLDVVTSEGTQTFVTFRAEQSKAGEYTESKDSVEFTDIKISEITTKDEFEKFLAALAKNKFDNFKNANGHVVLGDDINLEGLSIGTFAQWGATEVFDGQGHTLYNASFPEGFFTNLAGTFKNVIFENVQFEKPFITTVLDNALLENVAFKHDAPADLDGDGIDDVAPATYIVKTNNGTINKLSVDGLWLTDGPIDTNSATGTLNECTVSNRTVFYNVPSPAAGKNFGMLVNTNNGLVQKCVSSVNTHFEIEKVMKSQSTYWGGIVGYNINGYIKECEFNGKFDFACREPESSGYHGIGGIAGCSDNTDKENAMIENCVNNGDIVFRYSYKASGCYFFIGGVLGTTTAGAKSTFGTVVRGIIKGCTNNGNISDNYVFGGSGSYPCVGGVVGYIEGDVIECTNRGDITLTNESAANTWTDVKLGGVVGAISNKGQHLYNYGKVTFNGLQAGGTESARGSAGAKQSCFGGVVGAAGRDMTVAAAKSDVFEDCVNYADQTFAPSSITGTPDSIFGGVFGSLTATAKDCVNKGNIAVICGTNTIRFGGVVGLNNGDMENCSNEGALTLVTPAQGDFIPGQAAGTKFKFYFGGVAGSTSNTVSFTLTGCKNSGNLIQTGGYAGSTIVSGIGGIAGFEVKPTTFVDCTNTGSIAYADGINIQVHD